MNDISSTSSNTAYHMHLFCRKGLPNQTSLGSLRYPGFHYLSLPPPPPNCSVTCLPPRPILAVAMTKLSGIDVAAHNTKDSCWVIVHGKAYDVTEFLPEQYVPSLRDTPDTTNNSFLYSPGGSKIILKYAGKDATEEFDSIHPPDTLDKVGGISFVCHNLGSPSLTLTRSI